MTSRPDDPRSALRARSGVNRRPTEPPSAPSDKTVRVKNGRAPLRRLAPDTRTQVWSAPSRHVLRNFGNLEASFTPGERSRSSQIMKREDQDDYVACHILGRLCAAEETNLDPRAVKLGHDTEGRHHGRPHIVDVPSLKISLSHTPGFVAVAVSRGDFVGVDVERHPRRLPRVSLALTSAEQRLVAASPESMTVFATLWTRKEAIIKAGLATIAEVGELELVHADQLIADSWGASQLGTVSYDDVTVSWCIDTSGSRFGPVA